MPTQPKKQNPKEAIFMNSPQISKSKGFNAEVAKNSQRLKEINKEQTSKSVEPSHQTAEYSYGIL